LKNAANEYNPSGLCQYILDLAKSFNRLYNELSILKEPDLQKKNFRLQLAKKTSDTLSHSMGLLGIEMVERM
jgi:arginyl-tRNA synthetase